jgi:3',5'-nucleoside bisphosphate phosphatase
MTKYDLHTHTYYSDGSCSPLELIREAAKINLTGLSITDHDSIEGLSEAMIEGKKRGLEIIPGVEIQGMECEILGYFFNKEDNDLNFLLEKHRKQRKKYLLKKIEALESYGIEVDIKEVLNASGIGQNPNSFHIAKVMIDKGYVSSIDLAFKEYLKNIQVRLEVAPTRVKKIIKVINEAGGKAVLPHPWFLKEKQKQEMESFVIKLIENGLSGIEVSGFIPEDVKMFRNKLFIDQVLEITKKYELIETAGSDFHGENSHKECKLGDYFVSRETIDLLRK